jgi:hypothetical protein
MNQSCFAAVTAALALFTLSPVLAQAPPGNMADGTLTIGDKTFRLTRAYAQAEDDVEGVRLNGPQKSVTVLLADADVPPDEVTDWFRCAERARAGKLHAVALRLDPTTKALFGVTVFYVDGPNAPSPPNISLSGQGLNHRITGLSLALGLVSGVAETQKPEKWLEMDEAAPARTYQYQVTFRAAVRPPAAVTAKLTGAAAQNSPQATAALAFFTALRAGDMAKVRTLALPNPQTEAFYKQMGPAKFKEAARQMTPDTATFRKGVKKVVVRGSTATLLHGSGDSIRLVRTDSGGWKVAN